MAGEAMTLLDYAATQKTNYLLQGFVNAMMDDKSPGGMGLLGVMKWKDIDSLTGIITRMVDEGGPTPTSRPINGAYNTGVAVPLQESISVGNIGQDVPIDKAFLLKQKNFYQGMTPKEFQTVYLARRIKRAVNYKLLRGTKATDPNGFNGVQFFCDTNQIIDMGTSDVPNGGSTYNTAGNNVWAAYTTQKARDFLTGLNRLLDAVPGATHLIMNDDAKNSLLISVRDGSSSGFFTTYKDSYDREVDAYRGVPIINPGSQTAVRTLKQARNASNAVLGNNFTYGSANNATEIYAIRIDEEDGVVGLQYNPLEIRDVPATGEATQGPFQVVRADWYPGLYRWREDAIAKLVGMVVV